MWKHQIVVNMNKKVWITMSHNEKIFVCFGHEINMKLSLKCNKYTPKIYLAFLFSLTTSGTLRTAGRNVNANEMTG